jgi:hypothetical protein
MNDFKIFSSNNVSPFWAVTCGQVKNTLQTQSLSFLGSDPAQIGTYLLLCISEDSYCHSQCCKKIRELSSQCLSLQFCSLRIFKCCVKYVRSVNSEFVCKLHIEVEMLPTLINVCHVTSRPGMILLNTHRTNSTHWRTDEEHSTSIIALAGF